MPREGIEIELSHFIAKIRKSFPDAKVFTERCVQDTPGEVWFLEELKTLSLREQWDTFIDITTYKMYFSPELKDISHIQERLRYVRRWQQTQLMWLPFVKNFVYSQNGDTLETTFELWRRYRLVPPVEAKMQTLSSCTIISNKHHKQET